MFHTRFLSPTDEKCAESSTYWQFFYYSPPDKSRFTHLQIAKMLYIYICLYMTLLIIDLDFLYQFNLGLIAPLFSFFSWNVWNFFFNFQKLAGLWLVGEVDNHVAIYGSKVAEDFSAFPRRSCYILLWIIDVLSLVLRVHLLNVWKYCNCSQFRDEDCSMEKDAG